MLLYTQRTETIEISTQISNLKWKINQIAFYHETWFI